MRGRAPEPALSPDDPRGQGRPDYSAIRRWTWHTSPTPSPSVSSTGFFSGRRKLPNSLLGKIDAPQEARADRDLYAEGPEATSTDRHIFNLIGNILRKREEMPRGVGLPQPHLGLEVPFHGGARSADRVQPVVAVGNHSGLDIKQFLA